LFLLIYHLKYNLYCLVMTTYHEAYKNNYVESMKQKGTWLTRNTKMFKIISRVRLLKLMIVVMIAFRLLLFFFYIGTKRRYKSRHEKGIDRQGLCTLWTIENRDFDDGDHTRRVTFTKYTRIKNNKQWPKNRKQSTYQ